MPANNKRSHARWDTWPPTQMRLQPNNEHDDAEIEDLDLAMDGDPINYFLTPAPLLYDDDLDMMDFDAGIEDSKHPAPIIRNVSPSNLEGLSLPPPRPPTPPRSPSTPDLDIDMGSSPPEDDEEYYIHFSRAGNQNPGLQYRPRGSGQSKSTASEVLAAPGSYHTAPTASRGRATTRPGPRPLGSTLGGRTRSWSSRHSPHSWREPSPDVWSIEEETEDEVRSEMSDSIVQEGREGKMMRAKRIDIQAAKPKKRVRFVLPVRDAGDFA